MSVKDRASASTAARSLFLFAMLSCAPERVHERGAAPHVAAPATIPAPPVGLAPTQQEHNRLSRRDLTIATTGLAKTIREADLPATLVDQLDDAFIWRLDLYAHLRPGDALTIWHRGERLVAARVELGEDDALVAAYYNGDLAPHAFYDQEGLGMQSALRSRPVDLGRITSRFGQRFDSFTGAPAFHRGVDYGVPIGTPVVAVAAGRVKAVGKSHSAGNFIKLAHVGGYESLYLHLERVDVKKNEVVDASRVIGRSGNTGRSTGPHLHYELRVAGIALDPLATLPPSTVALGPRARREHLAFIKHLQQMEDSHDGRTQHR